MSEATDRAIPHRINRLRSSSRAFDSLPFTVLTGHCKSSAISSFVLPSS
jgi:hypothetical protein